MLPKSEAHARIAQKLEKFSFKPKLDSRIVVFVFAHLNYLLFILSLRIIHPQSQTLLLLLFYSPTLARILQIHNHLDCVAWQFAAR